MTSHSEIERQAARWLIRQDETDHTPDERARFEAWLTADSRHRAAYLELERTWRRSDALKVWRPLGPAVDPSVLRSVARVSRSERSSALSRRWHLAIAVAGAMMMLATFAWFALTAGTTTYTTDVGGYERVHLEDGSTLQLNTDTQVAVDLTQHRRRIRLIRGEAFFEVARDATRPFDVVAGSASVRAVGTAFGVRRHSSAELEVLVTEGRVSVNPGNAARTPVATAVSAGEGVIARGSGIAIQRISQPEVARRLAWREGELDFKGQTLSQVIAEFNRYNRTRLQIVDTRLATLEVGGNFRANDLDGFVRALEATFPVRTEEFHGVIRIERRE